ncbi:DNA-binding transcriptional regulator, ArsR family [Consotaella salsifontis]|uniref:DNA-binding transcriptional regulator, ArsR family n=2 Tax=Consotaella salsifontis TaxID=1365950 RepID=A0A1T4PVG7_9HYPH|nr:DNA-binding transcriptional regulator, ArsR family [Consotaella salsifontis]
MAALEARAGYVAARLALMANPSRLLILCHLIEHDASVGELQGRIGLSQSALSQHLARLREAGFVATRRSAQVIYYSLADEEARAVVRALYAIYCAESPSAPPK